MCKWPLKAYGLISPQKLWWLEGQEVMSTVEEKRHIRIRYLQPAFQNEGKIKTVPYRQSMRELGKARPVLEEMLEGVTGSEGGRRSVRARGPKKKSHGNVENTEG